MDDKLSIPFNISLHITPLCTSPVFTFHISMNILSRMVEDIFTENVFCVHLTDINEYAVQGGEGYWH